MIEGKVINLRQLEQEDLQSLKEWRNSERVRRYTREYRLLNMTNQLNWFKNINETYPPKDLMFGITNKTGRLIGCCGLTYIDWKNRLAEVSIYIGKSHWQRKRAGSEAIHLLLEHGFEELGLNKIWAEVFDFNEPSARLFEGSGFKKDGILRAQVFRFGTFHDSIVYSILSAEYRSRTKRRPK